MPNWCQNVLYVNHNNKKKMAALLAAVKAGEMCQHIKPMPKELEDTTAPSDSPNWYDWRLANWDTKWDICDAWDTDEIYHDEHSGEFHVFKFDTAWSPPIAVYDEMVKQGFDVRAEYIEYGVGYCGDYFNGDEYHYDEIPEDRSVNEHLQSEYA